MPFAKVGDIDLYYEVDGDGPPLVLLAGLGATTKAYGPLPKELGLRFTTVRYDYRGIGRSSKHVGAHFSLALYAQDLAGLLDHLSIEKAHVLGSSMGGIVALQFALDYPERIDKLVLMTTAGHITPYLRRIGLLFRTLITHLPPEEYARTIATLAFSNEFVDKFPETVAQVEELIRPDPSDCEGIKRQVAMLAGGDFSDRLSRIRVPVLVVAGAQDTLVPVKYSQMLAAAIPGARLAVMNHSAHSPFTEEPLNCMKTVLEFLGGRRVRGVDWCKSN